MTQSEQFIKKLLKTASITINGENPWDIQVHDDRFYDCILREGVLGFGESYMDGWWDVEQLDETVARIHRAHIEREVKKSKEAIWLVLRSKLINVTAHDRAFVVGQKHYDIGNELYDRMLDPDMNYTCGYWKDFKNFETAWKKPENLHKAQLAKLDLVCRKLGLQKGMKVLEPGCGFGNFAYFAAKNYGVKIVGYTVSKEQAVKARERCEGLSVEIRHDDYRNLKKEKFDRIVSIGMMEHVTYKNYAGFMELTDECLTDDGLMLIHTIGSNESVITVDPWTEKYTFPNSHLPSIAQIGKAAEGKFIVEDLQNFGPYYYPTLMAWDNNFKKSWNELQKINPEKYTERFYRMWEFYLLASAGGFKARSMQLYQFVFSKSTQPEVYQAVR
ncbi:MAG: cyclopropane fatty acyl phospholipid synthase [Candidatus Levyibacteriota bacterium]